MFVRSALLASVIPIVLASAPVLAQEVDGAAGEAMLLEEPASIALLDTARADLFAYRMAAAERSLRRLQRHSDGRPAALYHLTLAALHRALMSDEDIHFDAFFARSDSLAEVLSDEAATPWRDVMEADRHLWRALAHLKRGRHLRGAWAGRAAYRGYDRVVAAVPDLEEAYVGLGLLHVSIGSMPKSLRFVLDVLGYEGGIARGMEELERAHRSARYGSEEAGAVLAVMSEMLSLDEAEGLGISETIRMRHPDSPLAAHVHAFLLLSNRRAEAAAEVLVEGIEASVLEDVFYIHYLDFYLGEAYFRTEQYAEAERMYRRYLERHGGPALKAMTYMGLGMSLEMQGRRNEAVEAFEQVRAARTFDTDEAARREAVERLAGPMSEIDRVLLRAANAFDSDRLDEAERLLDGLSDQGGLTNDQEAEIAFRAGRIHLARGAPSRALSEFARAEDLRGDQLSRWAPWSAYYRGTIHLRHERLEAARSSFDRALSYEGRYDYYQALEQSVRAVRAMHGLD